MASIGTKLVTFLIILHSLFYFAGANGLIQGQAGEVNENKQFVERFDENATETVNNQNEDASIFDNIRLSAQAIPFIGFIVEIFSAPYTFIDGTGIPNIYVLMFKGLLGFFESVAVASFIRGYEF